LCEAKRAPKGHEQDQYQGATNYGYHVDAGLFAAYLKRKAIAAGVRHVVDKVVDVVLTEQGFIDYLITTQHGVLNGEFFVDCSGFRSLLINRTLQEAFIPFKETLFCNRAIAINLPADNAKYGINPHTTATALKAGWVWHTPLYGRSGNGYVYASDFISPDMAEQEFRQYLRNEGQQVEARHLTMQTGHHRRVWVNNCVSLGLAGGFIEPLKSTGILLIELGLNHLMQNFPDRQMSSSFRDKYNRIMTHYYEEFRDFIVLHYYLSQRSDTSFWQAVRHEPKLSDRLQARLERYRTMLPIQDDALEFSLLGHILPYAYHLLLCGFTCLPEQSAPILDYENQATIQRAFNRIKIEADLLKQKLPDHYQYLRQLHLLESLRTAYMQDKL
jgi:tryptophan halogenase